jgi:FHA domain
VTRYRLRFLLQEFDLPRGITLIGRSLDCHVTIEDPLVSRQHARVVIEDDRARVEDLESRNGVKVNGATIKEPTSLKDGDRLRIGTQDLVFCRVDPVGAAHAKTTGVLRLCANCRLPYPREMLQCPNCAATEQTDEETLSGAHGGEKQTAWSLQLLTEALDKALTLGRDQDAERIIRRATAQMDELIAAGALLTNEQIEGLTRAAARASVAARDSTWAVWVPNVYRRLDRVPSPAMIDTIVALSDAFAPAMSEPVSLLAEYLRANARAATPADADGLARIERLSRRLAGLITPNPDSTQGPASNPTLS